MAFLQQTLDHDEVSLVMASTPEVLYDLLSDVTRMREFSPEVVESRWIDGATGPAVGARFANKSRFSRGPAIGNKATMTVLEPGKKVAWSRTEPFGGTVEWAYELLPHAEGVEVVESYSFSRPVSRIGWLIITPFTSRDRGAQMHAGMEETLQRLRRYVES
ncbi:MAG: SRPBCC family protein [Acidimicrobiales bacterium]|nr:SRPBCC family protein [Acidimicrobiales bacterium]